MKNAETSNNSSAANTFISNIQFILCYIAILFVQVNSKTKSTRSNLLSLFLTKNSYLDRYTSKFTQRGEYIFLNLNKKKIVVLFFICYWLVHLAWRKKQDPDNVCIPYLTGIGDFLGTTLLALCFHILWLSGETSLQSSSFFKN
jgi:hypothetical protein